MREGLLFGAAVRLIDGTLVGLKEGVSLVGEAEGLVEGSHEGMPIGR